MFTDDIGPQKMTPQVLERSWEGKEGTHIQIKPNYAIMILSVV